MLLERGPMLLVQLFHVRLSLGNSIGASLQLRILNHLVIQYQQKYSPVSIPNTDRPHLV
jgi:hypothetical protein